MPMQDMGKERQTCNFKFGFLEAKWHRPVMHIFHNQGIKTGEGGIEREDRKGKEEGDRKES